MTDLHNRELSEAQLDAIAALDTNLGSDTSIARAAQRVRAAAATARIEAAAPGMDQSVEDAEAAFLTFRRTMTTRYLKAREAYEENATETTAARYEAVREALALVFTAEGGWAKYGNAKTVTEAINHLEHGIGEMWVSLWVCREGVDVDFGQIAAIADTVRDWIASGATLPDLPMWELAAPYLGVEL